MKQGREYNNKKIKDSAKNENGGKFKMCTICYFEISKSWMKELEFQKPLCPSLPYFFTYPGKICDASKGQENLQTNGV